MKNEKQKQLPDKEIELEKVWGELWELASGLITFEEGTLPQDEFVKLAQAQFEIKKKK
jgi:hypothetical protein